MRDRQDLESRKKNNKHKHTQRIKNKNLFECLKTNQSKVKKNETKKKIFGIADRQSSNRYKMKYVNSCTEHIVTFANIFMD